jgi:tetratricopeptide (TPR) repeat protein
VTNPCPHCGKTIAIYQGKLFREEDAKIEEWLTYLKPLGVDRGDFLRHRQELAQAARHEVEINDTIWRMLNSLVSKYAKDQRKLFVVYSEMAELAASEWKDPTPYLERAARYSPNGVAELRRHQDPMDIMVLKSNEAHDLEKQGDTGDAISIYEFLVKHKYPHPGPYERLRVLYSKQKRYKDAIRVCKAFIKVHKKVGYSDQAQKFAEWISKLEQKRAGEL